MGETGGGGGLHPAASGLHPAVSPRTTAFCEREVNYVKKALYNCKSGVLGMLENYFHFHGKIVARNPGTVIVVCLVLTLVSAVGMLRFYEEIEVTALWVPRNSQFKIRADWVKENFPQELRYNQIIFSADNVLTPHVVQQMLEVRRRVDSIQTKDNRTWQDLCFRVPVVTKPNCNSGHDRLQRDVAATDWDWQELDDDPDWGLEPLAADLCPGVEMPEMELRHSLRLPELVTRLGSTNFSLEKVQQVSVEFYPEPYCSLVRHAPTTCFLESFLELFNGEEEILTATEEDILRAVNTRNTSTVFMVEKNFSRFLSEIRYNSSGHVVSAGIATMTWVTRVNTTHLDMKGSAQRGEKVDEFTFNFEGEMIEAVTNRSGYQGGAQLFVNVHRMFFESLERKAFGDAFTLLLGYFIVFVYVMVMLGRLTWVEQRFYLSVVGITGVAMGILVSYSLCSVMGFSYSAAHTVMPFLLLGIGIDDMFVIVQCLATLTPPERKLGLDQRIGAAMAHAGVAITITSVTDVIAFGIGATTSLPALRSFCVYAGIGVLVIFFLQTTWFTAWLTLDERRRCSGRNSFLPCIKHQPDPTTPNSPAFLERMFSVFSEWLMTVWVKVLVLVSSLVLMGLGIYGLCHLRMEFSPEWLMDPGSEVYGWWMAHKRYFPSSGEPARLYFKDINYAENFNKIESLLERLNRESDIISSVDSWTSEFKKFVDETDSTVNWLELDEEYFREKLSHFLFSPRGAKYQLNFKFSGELTCGFPAPRILISTVEFKHVFFDEASEWVPAMLRVNELVSASNITGSRQPPPHAFTMGARYANWETDRVIGEELYQNIISSIVAIFLTVLLFLASFRGACIVIVCVSATLVNVAGFMNYWGLTIDIITCNSLVVSVGLCVDFSVHIAHGFLSSTGTRDERVIHTMTKIGPAVLNGGISTLLAFILLSTSQTYVFLSFFKIFFLICVFGLFHGLVFLPVLLSVAGPVYKTEPAEPGSEPETEKLTKLELKTGSPAT